MTAMAQKTVPCCVIMSWRKGCFRISQSLNLSFKVSCLLRTMLCIPCLSSDSIWVHGHFTFARDSPTYPSSATTRLRGSRWWIRVCQILLWLQTYPQENNPQATLNSRQLCQPQTHNEVRISLRICARKMGSLLQPDLAGGCGSRWRQCWWGSHWHYHSFSCSWKQSTAKKVNRPTGVVLFSVEKHTQKTHHIWCKLSPRFNEWPDVFLESFGVDGTRQTTNHSARDALLWVCPYEVERPEKLFSRSFNRDQIPLRQVSPVLWHTISSRAKELTEGPVLHSIQPYTVSALVLDFLSPEDKILWGRLRYTHSLVVAVVHDDALVLCVERWWRFCAL